MAQQGGADISSSSSSVVDGLLKPVITMVVAHISYAAMNILYKVAAESGMKEVHCSCPFSLLFAWPVIVAIASSLLLNERLSLRSALGGILIVCGLYMVLWRKSKEMKTINNVNNDQEQPAKAAVPSSTKPHDPQFIEIIGATQEPDQGRC